MYAAPHGADASPEHHLPHDPFEGAHRVVLEQAETFSAPPSFVLPSLGQVDHEVGSGPVERAREASDYYDTAALALARAGITVRRNCADGRWIVTMAEVLSAGETIRREVWYPTSASVPVEVRRLLALQLQGKPLSTVARATTRRVTIPLINRSGVRIVDVVDEHTVAIRDTGSSSQFRVIDIQVRDLDGVGRRVLDTVHRVLTDAGCVREARSDAYARALGVDSISA